MSSINNRQLAISNSRGVTVVELLVYIGLLSVFMVVLLDVFTTILGARLTSQSTSGISQDARYILTKLAYDVTNADSITTPVAFGNSGGSLVLTNGAASYAYSLDGSGNIILNGQKLNSNDTTITNLSFTKLGNPGVVGNKPTVKISFTIRSNVIQKSGQEEETVVTTLGIR